MPYRFDSTVKSRQENPFRGQLQMREIVIEEGSRWPTGVGSDYVIPLGVPVAPVSGGDGEYAPVPRATVSAATAAQAICTVQSADGFYAGMVVNLLQASPTVDLVTIATTGTIGTVVRATGLITLTEDWGIVVSAGCFLERADVGAGTNPPDAVFLGQNVQTRIEDLSEDVMAPAVGYIAGQVEIAHLANNCYNTLTPRQIPGFDYIPATPGQ